MKEASLTQQASIRASCSSPRPSSPPSATSWFHRACKQSPNKTEGVDESEGWAGSDAGGRQYHQVISQDLCHADVKRLQAAAASCGDDGSLGLAGGQIPLELGAQVTSVNIHQQDGSLLVFGRHVGTPHLPGKGGQSRDTEAHLLRNVCRYGLHHAVQGS